MSAASPRPAAAPVPGPDALARERSLDPESWGAMRALGHRMIDDVMTYLERIGDGPVWQKPSARAMEAYRASVPKAGTSPERIYEDYIEHVLPFVIGNGHPRFWGWVSGTGTPMGMLADLLASGANVHAAFGDQSGTHLERQVIGWFTEIDRKSTR